MKHLKFIARIEADLDYIQSRLLTAKKTKSKPVAEAAWKDVKSRSRGIYSFMLKLQKDKKVDFR